MIDFISEIIPYRWEEQKRRRKKKKITFPNTQIYWNVRISANEFSFFFKCHYNLYVITAREWLLQTTKNMFVYSINYIYSPNKMSYLCLLLCSWEKKSRFFPNRALFVHFAATFFLPPSWIVIIVHYILEGNLADYGSNWLGPRNPDYQNVAIKNEFIQNKCLGLAAILDFHRSAVNA